jgi:ubiquinone/menaquinone biosynthesis C-methylase UbiE
MFYNDVERRKWQNPEAILTNIGVKPGITFVDVGCGTGFFTIPAAQMIGDSGKVFAMDINADFITRLQERANIEHINNLSVSVGRAEDLVLCDQCADIVFFGIVLHDFQDTAKVLENAKKMVKAGGILVNLDWKKKPMDFGPPLKIRFDEQTATGLIKSAGFNIESIEDSGPYHYIITARP